MAGSGKSKHRKGKGKVKSTSDAVHRQSGTSNSDPHIGQTKSGNMSEFKTPKDDNQQLQSSLSMDLSGWDKSAKRALEMLLYNKLEGIYAEAFQSLLALGYDGGKARKAMLMNGHWRGEKSLLTNIIDNSVKFLKSNPETDKEALHGCTYLSERVTSLMRMLIKDMQQFHPNESDAMKELLGIGVGVGAESSTHPQFVQTENYNEDVDLADGSSRNITDQADTSSISEHVPEEFEAALPQDLISEDHDWDDSFLLRDLEVEPNDPRDMLVLSVIEEYRELKKQVKETKEWALAKVMQAVEKVHNHLSELKRLRQENFENEKWKTSVTRLKEMDIALWKAMYQLERSTAALRQLEHQNSVMRQDIDRYSLDVSKTNKNLREVEKRERKFLEMVRANEKEEILLEEQVEEQKQKVLQLNQELLQVNKAQEEAEAKLAEQLKEKELAFALVAEEERLRNISEADLRSKQASLHQKAETNRQLLKDNLHRLEDELTNLLISQNESFELSSPESIEESLSGRECIQCLKKNASVLFLPCAHQVVCSKCNEEEPVRATCPCCQVQIVERIAVYGSD